MGKCDCRPSAIIFGPPMPAKSRPGRRAFSAAMRCAARRSPEASPATMATRGIGLADDAALARVEEFDEGAYRRTARRLLLELLARCFERKAGAVKRPVGALQAHDVLRRKPAPPQALAVDAVRLRHVAG